MQPITTICPSCGGTIHGAFGTSCPHCPLTVGPLAGRGTTDYQVRKWNEHTDILQGRDIQLYGRGSYNASFDYNGYAKIDDAVRYAITYGDRAYIQQPGRPHKTLYIAAYLHEQIGAGTAIHFPGTVPCTGIVLVSANSGGWGHSHPFIEEWANRTFAGQISHCRTCG